MMTLPLPAGSGTRSHASQLRVVDVGLALTTQQGDLGCASGIRRFERVRGQRGAQRTVGGSTLLLGHRRRQR